MVVARAQVCVGSHMPGSDLCVEDLRSPEIVLPFCGSPQEVLGQFGVYIGVSLFTETTI